MFKKIMFNTIPRLIRNTYYLLLFILLTTFYLILPTPVHAATVTWDGGAGTSEWNTVDDAGTLTQNNKQSLLLCSKVK